MPGWRDKRFGPGCEQSRGKRISENNDAGGLQFGLADQTVKALLADGAGTE